MQGNRNNSNAGRQAPPGNPSGFQEVTLPGAKPAGDPASWLCLLHGVPGGLRLRLGRHCFRLSSDTIYFVEEIDPEPAGGRPASGEAAAASGFTYVCGSPDALVRALQDLGRRCGSERFRNEDPIPFRARAN